jgi:hypothetical protein
MRSANFVARTRLIKNVSNVFSCIFCVSGFVIPKIYGNEKKVTEKTGRVRADHSTRHGRQELFHHVPASTWTSTRRMWWRGRSFWDVTRRWPTGQLKVHLCFPCAGAEDGGDETRVTCNDTRETRLFLGNGAFLGITDLDKCVWQSRAIFLSFIRSASRKRTTCT